MRSAKVVAAGGLLAVALILIGFGLSPEREEAAIYATYVKAHQSRDRSGNRISKIVVLDRTTGWEWKDAVEEAASKLAVPSSVINSWKLRNARISTASSSASAGIGYPIDALLHFPVPHALISDRERSEITSKGGRAELERRYPNSRYVAFSRVGFHWTRMMAMLYVYDGNEEGGMLFIYVGAAGFWKEVASTVAWIS
jgi:hypothetical protein